MRPRQLVIDSHCHAGTGDGLTGPWDTDAPLEQYLRRATAAGINGTVVFATFNSDYRTANRQVATIVQSDPRRLLGYAFVHPERDRGRIAAMVEEAVLVYGFRGIKVHRHDARLTREICEAARAWRLPVLYDVTGEVAPVELFAQAYRDVAFVIPHLASFADDWAAQRAFIDVLARHPNVFTDSSGVRRFDLLVEAVRRAGPGKLLFGSDGPWLHPGLELAKITALGLGERAEQAVLSGNLLRLLRRVRTTSAARSRSVLAAQPPASELEASRSWHWHHIFPQALRAQFAAIGIDVDDYTILIPPMQHLRVVHGGGWYNRWWRDWLNKPGRSAGGATRAATALLRNHPRLKSLQLHSRVVQRYPRELEILTT